MRCFSRETANCLFIISKDEKKLLYGHKLKDTMEDEAEKKTNGQQRQDSDEQYDARPKIKLVPKKISVKEFRGDRNLYGVNQG